MDNYHKCHHAGLCQNLLALDSLSVDSYPVSINRNKSKFCDWYNKLSITDSLIK